MADKQSKTKIAVIWELIEGEEAQQRRIRTFTMLLDDFANNDQTSITPEIAR